MYRKLSVAALLLFLFAFIFAGQPKGVNYQAIIRDDCDTPLKHRPVIMRSTFYDGSLAGPMLYGEVQVCKTDSIGLMHMFIGGGEKFKGDAIDSAINSPGPLFLKVEMDKMDGMGFVKMSEVRLYRSAIWGSY